MAKMAFGFVSLAMAGLLMAGSLQPAAAQTADRQTRRHVAQQPPRIVIHPRRHRPLSPSATRHCESWLAQEIWPNGQPVITPQMRCWWED